MTSFMLDDFIEDYPSQDDEDIQWKIAERKEFYELQSLGALASRTEQLEGDGKQGRFFNHQELLLRYVRHNDRIFNIQDTGTGKTGGIIDIAEFYKKNNQGIKRIHVIVPGKSVKDAFKDQIRKLSDPEEYTNERILKAMAMEGGQKIVKNNLNRLFNEWYSINTYKVFAKEKLNDEQIIEQYSDCIFFLDEVHWFRNSTNNKDETTKREMEEVYSYFWRIFHLAKRSKVIIATATPMIIKTEDFVPLINLLLPEGRQLPEYIDYNMVTLEQLEPYFRGLFTYIRFDNKYINIIEKGESLEKYKHNLMVASNEKGNPKTLPPVEKSVENGKIVTIFEPEYEEIRLKKMAVSSYIKMVMVTMSSHQLKSYRKYSKTHKNFGYSSLQAALFVFPNGMISREAEKIYLDYDEKKNMVFRTSKEGEEITYRDKGGKINKEKGLGHYFPAYHIKSEEAREKSLENLRMMSCKFHYFLVNELDKKGSSFCYIQYVVAAGAKLLGLFLRMFGYDEIRNVSSIYDTKGDRIYGIKKKKRYAILTAETPDIQSVINVFNSKDNIDGEYIQIIIGTEAVRDGINLKNVRRGYIMTPGWHESGMYQAMRRFIRAESHKLLYEREGDKIDVEIYRLAATAENEIGRIKKGGIEKGTIDVRNYIRSEDKDISLKRIFRFMKITAWDAYLNYTRNVLPTDVSYTPSADYGEKYFTIWGSEESPSGAPGLPSPKRNGIALNQGPNKYDVIYNTYNIFYSSEVIKRVKSEIQELFKTIDFIEVDDFKKILREKRIISNDYTFYNSIEEMILNREIIKDTRGIIDCVLTITGSLLHLRRFNFHQNDYISTEKNIYFDFPYLPIYNHSEEEEEDIYKKLESLRRGDLPLSKEDITRYYVTNQNYEFFKRLLEDSIIRIRDGDPKPINELFVSMFDNYVLETKIPYGYIRETRKALSGENRTGQGRMRGEKSIAGLKYINLDEVDPEYDMPDEGPSEGGKTVYVHFYRSTEKTGFGITSILEGKERQIRILSGDEFADADIAENFVYNYLFNKKYDVIMADYRKSKYYGTYILRGSENEKDLVKKERSFFRIVDNTNPRNKGLVCGSGKVKNLKPILTYVDTEKRYTNIWDEKSKKNQVCEILRKLFQERGLLFTSF